MKTKRNPKVSMKKNEDPIEFCRRLRHSFFSKFDYDYSKVTQFLKKEEQENKHRIIDVSKLRKLGKTS